MLSFLLVVTLMHAPDATDYGVEVLATEAATFWNAEDCGEAAKALNDLSHSWGTPDYFYCTIIGDPS